MNYSQVTVDILQNEKYAGAIDSIKLVANLIDTGFGMAITLVAFLIIIVALFKNVLAGAYCAYPKFWDRVDAAHKEGESGGKGWLAKLTGMKAADINAGSFSNAIMRLLPNIRALTDFEGDTYSAKAYFIRAIPQMLMCIIIGAFIYNGYYRDTAAKVVDFGSEMVSRVLLEVDPIAVFDQITGAAGRPVFASDNSEIPQQQLVNKIATSAYNAVIGEYNDISGADDKRALVDVLESKVNTWVNELESINPTYTDGESWKSLLQVTITTGEVDISKINGQSSSDGLTVQYALQFPVSDLNLPSNINVGASKYVRIRLNFEKLAVSAGKHAVTDLTWHVSSASGNGTIATVNVGQNLSIRNTSSNQDYTATKDGNSISLTIDYVDSKTRQAQVLKVSNMSGALSGIYTISGNGIPVSDAANGRTHYIKYIAFDNSNAGTLSSDSEGVEGIDWSCTNLGVVSKTSATTD